jgi:hypothetical protein
MKKKIGLLTALLLLVGGVYWFQFRVGSTANDIKIISEVVEGEKIYLEIDFGDSIASFSGTLHQGDTVLEILNRLASDEHEVTVKEYDFGSLVMSIDGRENTKDKSWIYFVNGNSGEVGADTKIVEKGDLVKWGYITPIY